MAETTVQLATMSDERTQALTRPARRGRRIASVVGAAGMAAVLAACSGGTTSASSSESAGTRSAAPKADTCADDPAKATSADVDPNNPTLRFSWLCGGADTVFVYQGPFDDPIGHTIVGNYFGDNTHPGKNVAPAKCYITDGRSVPSHPEKGELPEPASSDWFEIDLGNGTQAWAPKTYSFNGEFLEKIIQKCDITPPTALPTT